MRKVEKHSPFHFMRPTWAVNEAFNRKVGQAPFETVHRLPLSDLSVFQSWEAEGISMALGTLCSAHTPYLGLFGVGYWDPWSHAQNQPWCGEKRGRKRLQIGAMGWGKIKDTAPRV